MQWSCLPQGIYATAWWRDQNALIARQFTRAASREGAAVFEHPIRWRSAETLTCGQLMPATGACLAGLEQQEWAPMAKFEPPENEEERRAWIKRQKAKGVRAFKGRYGWAASAAPLPKNPQTADQQDHRRNVPAVTRRWSTLTLNQCAAWRSLAANTYFITETGERVRRNCYQLFVKLNVRRADLGLPQFSDPPAKAVFSTRPVFELAVSYVAGKARHPSARPGLDCPIYSGAGGQAQEQWRPRGPALPVSGAAGRPNRRHVRPHRAVCRPVWGTES